MTRGQNWFEQGGQAYARFRPTYPPALADCLASLAPGRGLALDAGCGSGQLTRLLASSFERVLGIDPSADQLAHALPHDRIGYCCAPAEQIPLADGTASLVTAAQAAHWFALPAFYAEARRIARPGAILALASYGVPSLDADLEPRFQRFYHDEIGPYWPPERRLVDGGYAGIAFPFEEIAPPALAMRCAWRLPEFLGYLGTWSALRRAGAAGQGALLEGFAQEFGAAWGEPGRRRTIQWPLALRLGRLA